MLGRVAFVRTDVSEDHSASIIIVHRLPVTPNIPSSPIIVTLVMEAQSSSETRATRRYIPEDAILHSHCYENLKSYL
jgi:hypothetical protein